MDKDKILDYVRKTPANTNPNVLKTMLDDSGGEMNPGYSCTETVTLLTDESVTTVFDEVNNSGKLAYSTSIDADTIRVTFDGTEYTCNAQEGEMGTLYGAPMGEEGIDWSEYPFQISSGLRNDIYTETAGTYQVKIETVEEVIETTPCFEKAVNSVVGGGSGGAGGTEPLIVRYDHTEVNGNIYTHYFDRTWQEVANALTNFTPIYIHGFTAHSEYIEESLTLRTIINVFQSSESFYATMSEGTLRADSADGALYYKYKDDEDN